MDTDPSLSFDFMGHGNGEEAQILQGTRAKASLEPPWLPCGSVANKLSNQRASRTVLLREFPVYLDPEAGLVAHVHVAVADFGVLGEQVLLDRIAVDITM